MAKTASISLRIVQETKDILAGKIKAKSYANVKEMIEDL